MAAPSCAPVATSNSSSWTTGNALPPVPASYLSRSAARRAVSNRRCDGHCELAPACRCGHCVFRPKADTIPFRWRTPFRRHGGQGDSRKFGLEIRDRHVSPFVCPRRFGTGDSGQARFPNSGQARFPSCVALIAPPKPGRRGGTLKFLQHRRSARSGAGRPFGMRAGRTSGAPSLALQS